MQPRTIICLNPCRKQQYEWPIKHVRLEFSLINPLAPGRCGFDFRYAVSKCVVVIAFIFSAVALMRMAQDPTDDTSTLVQVMAWCRQAASH